MPSSGVPHAAECGGDAAGHIMTIDEAAAEVGPQLARLRGVIERHMRVGADGRQCVGRNVELLRWNRIERVGIRHRHQGVRCGAEVDRLSPRPGVDRTIEAVQLAGVAVGAGAPLRVRADPDVPDAG